MFAMVELTHPQGYTTYVAVRNYREAEAVRQRCTLESLSYRVTDNGEHGENLFSKWYERTRRTFYGSTVTVNPMVRFIHGARVPFVPGYTTKTAEKRENKTLDITC